MGLNEFLSEKKQSLLNRWFDAVLETYPQETAVFLKKQKNQFANPVGSNIMSSLELMFDAIVNSADADVIGRALDSIVRIRAVQEFLPSQALFFIPQLKDVVRDAAKGTGYDLSAFEQRVDGVLMQSFDLYMQCREKIYDIKANEMRNMTSKLLERANRIFEAHWRGAGSFEEIALQSNKSEKG